MAEWLAKEFGGLIRASEGRIPVCQNHAYWDSEEQYIHIAKA